MEAIAVHTFLVVTSRWTPPKGFRIPIVVIVCALLYRAGLYAAVVGSKRRGIPVFQPTPLWCTISNDYGWGRIPTAYLWTGISTAVSTVLYVMLFLYIRGNLVINSAGFWRMKLRKAPPPIEQVGGDFSMNRQSLKMLAYPIFNIVLSVPYWAMRWSVGYAAQNHIRSPWYFVCVLPHYAGGLEIVILLRLTRPTLLGRAPPQPKVRVAHESSEPKFAHPDPEQTADAERAEEQ
ncbi:hypothetical protein EXIGLDRAFT_765898 [Exidia glandulosa HHB12029]|uniref:Glucose receptor Git3 N-terminal domain-containing protein n=1 Tax=Exidia glandulosa HHB12029 TaxID=1314781 RepID=A0A165K5D6_EXIGL|nr:hypothetical protein EXIGLDRAFT_765898 [Exidia glandulosa HHB12029]